MPRLIWAKCTILRADEVGGSPRECGALSSNWYWVTNDVSPTFQKLGIFPDHPTVARDLELKETIVAVRPIITFAYYLPNALAALDRL